MAQKPETLFSKRIKPLLEALPNTWVERVQQVSIRGTPDWILCVRGHFVALELKKDDETMPDALQIHKLNKIQRASGLAFVVSPENWEAIYKILIDIATGKRVLVASPEDAQRRVLTDH